MVYTKEHGAEICQKQQNVVNDLQALMMQTVIQGQKSPSPKVREHLLHGVGRRLKVIRKAIVNVFDFFPPTTPKPLDDDALSDVQINLHAFVINISGIFDNWAWAFVFHHGIATEVGCHQSIGLFKKKTIKFLPLPIKAYLKSDEIKKWHKNYLKSYRDALAHRIPLYIPPAELTDEESERYNTLEKEKFESIFAMQFERHDQILKEQEKIGRPSFYFIHSFLGEDAQKYVLLHPQMVCDAMGIVEFGNLFLNNWHNRES